MRAWITRNADGTPCLFTEQPTWKKGVRPDWPDFWSGEIVTRIYSDGVEQIAQEIGVEAGQRRQIELTARPVGAAEGGEW